MWRHLPASLTSESLSSRAWNACESVATRGVTDTAATRTEMCLVKHVAVADQIDYCHHSSIMVYNKNDILLQMNNLSLYTIND